MNNLQPEERRAKADEIARLLEKEPLMVQDLLPLLKGDLLDSWKGVIPSPRCIRSGCHCDADVCEDCFDDESNQKDAARDDARYMETENDDLKDKVKDLETQISELEEKIDILEQQLAGSGMD